jgi:hypothetical protein
LEWEHASAVGLPGGENVLPTERWVVNPSILLPIGERLCTVYFGAVGYALRRTRTLDRSAAEAKDFSMRAARKGNVAFPPRGATFSKVELERTIQLKRGRVPPRRAGLRYWASRHALHGVSGLPLHFAVQVLHVGRARGEPGGRPKRPANIARQNQRPRAALLQVDFADVHVPATHQQDILGHWHTNLLASQRLTNEPALSLPDQTSGRVQPPHPAPVGYVLCAEMQLIAARTRTVPFEHPFHSQRFVQLGHGCHETKHLRPAPTFCTREGVCRGWDRV